MLAMLLGLRGCTAIGPMPAAADVAAAGLSRWVGRKQQAMVNEIGPPLACPPHCKCSSTGKRAGQQALYCVWPHRGPLLWPEGLQSCHPSTGPSGHLCAWPAATYDRIAVPSGCQWHTLGESKSGPYRRKQSVA